MAALLVFIVFLVCIAGSVPIGVSMIVEAVVDGVTLIFEKK